jgi:hypothetical protein
MIGLKDPIVGKAIEAGFLSAAYTSKRYEIRLGSLALLAKETITTAELARRAAVSREGVRAALQGLPPVATIYRRNFWPRPQSEKALGLPPLRAIAALGRIPSARLGA